MTDFKGFNPDKNLGTNFNANRQGKGAQPEKPAESQEPLSNGDPYANQKMDPNHVLKLLAAQSKLNIPMDIENPGITKTVAQFTSEISPERHARVSRLIEQAYTQEFGQPPSAEMLQNILDDYLVGRPSFQAG